MTAHEFLTEQGRLADAATADSTEIFAHTSGNWTIKSSKQVIVALDEFIDSVPRMVKALEAVLATHKQHKDIHPKDPSIINPNWFCCGAVQLGAISMYECVECATEEWPCPTVKAITAALEGEETNE